MSEAIASTDEKIVAEFHPSYLSYLCSIKKLGLIVVTAFLALPVMMLRDKFTNITITNQRIKFSRGIFIRGEDEIELYRIKDLKYEAHLIQRLFGIGDIIVSSSEATAPVIRLRDVKGASALRDTMRGLVEARRGQRGVREVDMT
jgi:uncharacterized membrane protein YdbT with pleckstrin-like domain